jgi:hypothetical protein
MSGVLHFFVYTIFPRDYPLMIDSQIISMMMNKKNKRFVFTCLHPTRVNRVSRPLWNEYDMMRQRRCCLEELSLISLPLALHP